MYASAAHANHQVRHQNVDRLKTAEQERPSSPKRLRGSDDIGHSVHFWPSLPQNNEQFQKPKNGRGFLNRQQSKQEKQDDARNNYFRRSNNVEMHLIL